MRKQKKILVLLTTVASILSIGFGIWHFFIPGIWKWYSYISPDAPELMIAVNAINIFFSLLLILLGIANILCVQFFEKGKFQTAVILMVSLILWITRVILQMAMPQGSQNKTIQYGMLLIFVFIMTCYAVSWILLARYTPNRRQAGSPDHEAMDCG